MKRNHIHYYYFFTLFLLLNHTVKPLATIIKDSYEFGKNNKSTSRFSYTITEKVLKNGSIYITERTKDKRKIRLVDRGLVSGCSFGFKIYALPKNIHIGNVYNNVRSKNEKKYIEVGYEKTKEIRKKGLYKGVMTSAVHACFTYFFIKHQPEYLLLVIKNNNTASLAIAKNLKLNEIKDKNRFRLAKDHNDLIFAINKKEWFKRYSIPASKKQSKKETPKKTNWIKIVLASSIILATIFLGFVIVQKTKKDKGKKKSDSITQNRLNQNH